jgi:hypothetical protein
VSINVGFIQASVEGAVGELVVFPHRTVRCLARGSLHTVEGSVGEREPPACQEPVGWRGSVPVPPLLSMALFVPARPPRSQTYELRDLRGSLLAPVIEAVGNHQTAPTQERVAKERHRRHRPPPAH